MNVVVFTKDHARFEEIKRYCGNKDLSFLFMPYSYTGNVFKNLSNLANIKPHVYYIDLKEASKESVNVIETFINKSGSRAELVVANQSKSMMGITEQQNSVDKYLEDKMPHVNFINSAVSFKDQVQDLLAKSAPIKKNSVPKR